MALKSWQHQNKAKREAEFLDALIDAAHTYIAEMAKPITILEMAKIGMARSQRRVSLDEGARRFQIGCSFSP